MSARRIFLFLKMTHFLITTNCRRTQLTHIHVMPIHSHSENQKKKNVNSERRATHTKKEFMLLCFVDDKDGPGAYQNEIYCTLRAKEARVGVKRVPGNDERSTIHIA